jgi:hypothetical protein
LWRVLKGMCKVTDPETQHISREYDTITNIWDVDTLALMVCTEAHYYHLTTDSSVSQDPEGMALRDDLTELMEDYERGTLQLKDSTLGHVLDTLTYLIANRADGEHGLYNSDTLLVLFDMLKSRQQNYDSVLQKLVMLLQMFRLGGQDRRTEALTYFMNDGYEKFNRKKTYGDLASILSAFVHRGIDQLRTGVQPAYIPYGEKRVLPTSATRLLDSLLSLDVPPSDYDLAFLSLPDNNPNSPATIVITYIKDLLPLFEWRTGDSVMWMVNLLCAWCQSDALSHENKGTILNILGSLLNWEWSDKVLHLSKICKPVLDTWKTLLLSDDSVISNATAKAACHALKSMFHYNTEQEKGKALLDEYLEHNFLDAISEFLQQPHATSVTRDQWHRLNIDYLTTESVEEGA